MNSCGTGEDKEIKFGNSCNSLYIVIISFSDLTLYESDRRVIEVDDESERIVFPFFFNSLEIIEYHTPYSRVPIDVHHAFITLYNRCENEQIREVDDLCRAFIIACKEVCVLKDVYF